MNEWNRIIIDDPQNNDKLAMEIWNKNTLIAMVRSKNDNINLTIFEKDVDIPFYWLYEILTEAKERIK